MPFSETFDSHNKKIILTAYFSTFEANFNIDYLASINLINIKLVNIVVLHFPTKTGFSNTSDDLTTLKISEVELHIV